MSLEGYWPPLLPAWALFFTTSHTTSSCHHGWRPDTMALHLQQTSYPSNCEPRWTHSIAPSGESSYSNESTNWKDGEAGEKNSISKRVTSALPWFLSTTLFIAAMQTTSNYGNTQSPPGWTKLCHKLKHTRCPKQSIKKGSEDFFAYLGYNEIDATLTNEFHPSLTY